MEHSIQEYKVQQSTEGMVFVSAYLTHDGVFKAAEWIRFRASSKEFVDNNDLGLNLAIECPWCGEIVQMPTIVVNDEGWLEVSRDGLEELERRGIEFD